MEISFSDQPLPKITCTLPAGHQRYRMPHAQAELHQYPAGQILRQVTEGRGFSIWWHHLFLQSPVKAQLSMKEKTLTLFFVMNGELTLNNNEGRIIAFHEYSYRLIEWEAHQSYHLSLNAAPYVFFQIHFHAEPGQEAWELSSPLFPEPSDVQDQKAHPPFAIRPRMKAIIEEIQTTSAEWNIRRLFLDLSVRSVLRMYLEDVTDRKKETVNSDQQEGLLRLVEKYIGVHLEERLTVTLLAKKAGVSRSWLQRIARRRYNKGIYEVVRDHRMREAGRLLLLSTLMVSEIALKVSDMTFSAFSASFKKYYGRSPRQYRKNGGRIQ